MGNPMSNIKDLYDASMKAKPVKQKREPGRKTDDDTLLELARERARDGATYWAHNWEAAEEDLNMLRGDQWPEKVKAERMADDRPCLVNNVLPTFCDQVQGEQRQNKPSIQVSAVDPINIDVGGEKKELKITSEGGKDYALAEVYTAFVKNIEYNCDAETSYDIAFQGAVESSMGYLRVRTDYLADDTFEQDVIIEHILNQFSVVLDPFAQEYDRSDMNWAFIHSKMEKTAFKEEYPDASPDSIAVGTEDMSLFFTEKTVTVSEYFTKTPVTKELAQLSDGRAMYIEDIEPVIDELKEKGITILSTRPVKASKIEWRKISAHDVLEGPIEIKTTTIPIVPVYGKSIVIKDKIYYRSVHRNAHDAQKMANYWDSAATESVALAPKAPFIGTDEHIEGHEGWDVANTKNLSMLTYTPGYQGDPGPRREQPAAMPAAEMRMGYGATDKIKATIGMFDDSLGNTKNAKSGVAIKQHEQQGSRGSFVFRDNLNKSIARVGKLCIELTPTVVDTERMARLKFEDETEDFVKLNQEVVDQATGKTVKIYDLNVSKYDVVVKSGPSYATQKEQTVQSMIDFAQAFPESRAAMPDLAARNMDWPSADKIAERLIKTVPSEMLDQQELKERQESMPEPPPPSPQEQAAMEMAKQELDVRGKEAEAKMAAAQADMAKSDAATKTAMATEAKAKADMVEAQARMQESQSMQEGGGLEQKVRELVAQALTESIG